MIDKQDQDRYLTVSALTQYLSKKFDLDPYLRQVVLIGEISNYNPKASRHRYFSLKDDQAKISAVMFKSAFDKLDFQPEEGMKVIVKGKVTLYGPSGSYQINIQSMQPDGVGALYQAFEQLKRKLQAQGVFDRPRLPIPKYPEQIAVITSPSGAVIRDILTTIRRRFPIVGVTVFPTRVQGKEASGEIIQAFQQVEALRDSYDLIILARGGGSIEDLWSFNEEAVARAIIESSLPVISSIGHETDITIADYVADLRAPTPTAAAELAVPVLTEILQEIQLNQQRLNFSMTKRLEFLNNRLQALTKSYVLQDPQRIYQVYAQKLDLLQTNLKRLMEQDLILAKQDYLHYKQRLYSRQLSTDIRNQSKQIDNLVKHLNRQIQVYIQINQQALQRRVQVLDALSPLKILARGYTIVEKDQTLIKSIKQVKVGDQVSLLMQDGRILSQINQIIQDDLRKDEILE